MVRSTDCLDGGFVAVGNLDQVITRLDGIDLLVARANGSRGIGSAWSPGPIGCKCGSGSWRGNMKPLTDLQFGWLNSGISILERPERHMISLGNACQRVSLDHSVITSGSRQSRRGGSEAAVGRKCGRARLGWPSR